MVHAVPLNSLTETLAWAQCKTYLSKPYRPDSFCRNKRDRAGPSCAAYRHIMLTELGCHSGSETCSGQSAAADDDLSNVPIAGGGASWTAGGAADAGSGHAGRSARILLSALRKRQGSVPRRNHCWPTRTQRLSVFLYFWLKLSAALAHRHTVRQTHTSSLCGSWAQRTKHEQIQQSRAVKEGSKPADRVRVMWGCRLLWRHHAVAGLQTPRQASQDFVMFLDLLQIWNISKHLHRHQWPSSPWQIWQPHWRLLRQQRLIGHKHVCIYVCVCRCVTMQSWGSQRWSWARAAASSKASPSQTSSVSFPEQLPHHFLPRHCNHCSPAKHNLLLSSPSPHTQLQKRCDLCLPLASFCFLSSVVAIQTWELFIHVIVLIFSRASQQRELNVCEGR